MNKIFIGIDGGGSKTTAVAFDETGNFLSKVIGESINFYSIGFEQARSNIKDIISKITEEIKTDKIFCVYIGMSALFEKSDYQTISQFTDNIIKAEHIFMDSDLQIALSGLLENDDCAMAISGTGSMVIARKKSGEIIQSGGWGYILGDEGSGYSIALKGIRSGIRAFEKISPETLLTGYLFEYYNVSDLYKLVDIFYDPPMPRNKIAQFAEVVEKCAEKGDLISIEIIKSEAFELAKNAKSLLARIKDESILGIYGGIFEHNKIFREEFTKEINSVFPKVKVKLLEFPPEIGAIFASFKELDLEITEGFLNNIRNTYLSEEN